jgi:hypothetical protein
MIGPEDAMTIRAVFAITLLLALVASAAAQERISRADRAKMRQTRETMRSLAQDLRAWSGTNEGRYPDKLAAIVDSGLRESLPTDDWGNKFAYSLDAEKGYKLVSHGADGKEGGVAANTDIVWTRDGEVLQLSEDQKAELELMRDAARHEARICVARKRMIVAGLEALKHRRESSAWPAKLEEAKRKGSDAADKATNACFTDPWGNALELRVLPADNIAVVCWGADGKEGGTGQSADFVISEREVRAHIRDSADSNPWGGGRNFDWQAQNLAEEVGAYKAKVGKLPEELGDLARPLPEGKGDPIHPGGIPPDRWGNEYVYLKLDDDNFAVVGLGKDSRAGGVKDDADTIWPAIGATAQPGGRLKAARAVRVRAAAAKEDERKKQEARVEVATEQMANIVEQLGKHKTENGTWPEKLEDIAKLLPGEEVPLDPWEHALIYKLTKDEAGTTTGFTLTCLGSDGAEGGQGHAADITFTQDGKAEIAPPGEAPEKGGEDIPPQD